MRMRSRPTGKLQERYCSDERLLNPSLQFVFRNTYLHYILAYDAHDGQSTQQVASGSGIT